MDDFWYEYVKLIYEEKEKLLYMDTDSIIVYIKTDDIYADIQKDFETDFLIQAVNYTGHYQKRKMRK